jgi:predicted Zn-dependent peptidase
VVAYHITYDGHPDAYPLHILAKILSDGDSSRLYRSLVYQKQVALAAFGEAKLIEHPNLFYAVAIVQNGHQPADVLRELQAEIDLATGVWRKSSPARLRSHDPSRPRAVRQKALAWAMRS